MNSSVAVLGVGASGLHAIRQLARNQETDLRCFDPDPQRMELGLAVSGVEACDESGSGSKIVILAIPASGHGFLAEGLLEAGSHVVSIGDDPGDVADLLELDGQGRELGRTVVVGAGLAPGLSCLLVRHAGNALDRVEQISVSKAGTGGPECARQHHRALKRSGWDLMDGEWTSRKGGSGRDLVWFPEPIGPRDCYRAALPSPVLLNRVYPDAGRVSARMSATRRDRSTRLLPMMRPPHADGGPGAVRVEVSGTLDGSYTTLVYGVMLDPSLACGLVSSVVAAGIDGGAFPAGSMGLSEIDDPVWLLKELIAGGVQIETIGNQVSSTGPESHAS